MSSHPTLHGQAPDTKVASAGMPKMSPSGDSTLGRNFGASGLGSAPNSNPFPWSVAKHLLEEEIPPWEPLRRQEKVATSARTMDFFVSGPGGMDVVLQRGSERLSDRLWEPSFSQAFWGLYSGLSIGFFKSSLGVCKFRVYRGFGTGSIRVPQKVN